MKAFSLSILALLLLGSSLFVRSQSSSEIFINLTAESEKTGFVKDLKAEDIRIKFGKDPQTITSFQLKDDPISVGILFDVSRSVDEWRRLNNYGPLLFLEGLKQFVNSANDANEYFIADFNQKTTIIVDRTQSRDTVIKGLEALREIKAEGTTGFYDALSFGLKTLSTAKHSKRVLLVISDGIDNSSKSSFNSIMQAFKASDVLLYSVCIDRTSTEGGASGQLAQGMADLHELAWVNGGRSLYIRRPIDNAKAFEIISTDLRSQYRLGFTPTMPKNGTWNKLKIEIETPKGNSRHAGKIVARYREGLIY